MERVKGIEPSSQAWEARILPLDHTRTKSAQGSYHTAGRMASLSGDFLRAPRSPAVGSSRVTLRRCPGRLDLEMAVAAMPE